MLTLVVREPPALRCNNNMQVAAELTNIYQVPVQVVPHGLAGAGAKAPAVYYGDELIALLERPEARGLGALGDWRRG